MVLELNERNKDAQGCHSFDPLFFLLAFADFGFQLIVYAKWNADQYVKEHIMVISKSRVRLNLSRSKNCLI